MAVVRRVLLQVLAMVRFVQLHMLPATSYRMLAFPDLSAFTSYVVFDCLIGKAYAGRPLQEPHWRATVLYSWLKKQEHWRRHRHVPSCTHLQQAVHGCCPIVVVSMQNLGAPHAPLSVSLDHSHTSPLQLCSARRYHLPGTHTCIRQCVLCTNSRCICRHEHRRTCIAQIASVSDQPCM